MKTKKIIKRAHNFARQIPIDGEPADVSAIAAAHADWLGMSNLPKLFLKAEPGAILAILPWLP